MIGQNQIIAARMKGQRPQAVWLRVGMPATPVLSKYDDPEKALQFGIFPTVDIPADEFGKRLDLRFLTSLRVHVHADEMTDKLLDLIDAVAAVANHVVVLAGDDLMEYKNNNWEVFA